MNSYRIYSRKTMGLDNRVWFVVIGVMILVEGLLVYRLIDPVKCTPFSFSVKTITVHTDTSFYTDEALSFTALTDDENITWDFGDNSGTQEGRLVTHRFSASGVYSVTASMSSQCEPAKQQVTIINQVADSIHQINISGSSSTITGIENTFSCSDIADSYDWSVVNYPAIVNHGTGSVAKFTFLLPSPYTIQVILNHDFTRSGSKSINVSLAKPIDSPINKNQPPCAQPIDSQTFQADLINVLNNNGMNAGSFSRYLCYGNGTLVAVNGNSPIPFDAFCQKLSAIPSGDKSHITLTLQKLIYDNNNKHAAINKIVVQIMIRKGLIKQDHFYKL